MQVGKDRIVLEPEDAITKVFVFFNGDDYVSQGLEDMPEDAIVKMRRTTCTITTKGTIVVIGASFEDHIVDENRLIIVVNTYRGYPDTFREAIRNRLTSKARELEFA